MLAAALTGRAAGTAEMAFVCPKIVLTAGAGPLTTVDLFRHAIGCNASADMLVHVDIAYPTFDLASLLQI